MKSLTRIAVACLIFCGVNVRPAYAEEMIDRNAVKARLQEFRERQARAESEQRLRLIEAHQRVWHRYGDMEIKRSGWIRQPDQVWMTQYQMLGAQDGRLGHAVGARNLTKPAADELPIRDIGGFRYRPKSFDASLDDLVRDKVVSPEERERFRSNNIKSGWISVSCRSLMISRLGAEMRALFSAGSRKYWENWFRPEADTDLEDLIADRCSSDAITVPRFKHSGIQ